MRAGRWVGLVLAASLVVPLSGCGKKKDTEAPVATPGLTAAKTRIPLGSPVEVTYKFTVAANAPAFTENYRVFVHFLDGSDERMWTDDHDPPVPTSQWKPGQTVSYARTVFVPIYPYTGPATVHMGLYSPRNGRRLPLAGETEGQRSYKVATLELLPQLDNVFLIFKDGWHPQEFAQGNTAIEWQWTKRDAVIAFRNPRRDATFYLQVDGRPDLFPRPQRVTVTIGDQTIDTFLVDTRDAILRKAPITAAQFGPGDMVELKIGVDQTFVPATLAAAKSTDPRELGVRVFHAFVEPK